MWFGLLMAALMQGTPVARTESASVPAPAAPSAKLIDRNGDALECREQKVTGSHFYARYCLTAYQWQRLHDDSVQGLYGRIESHPSVRANAEGVNAH